MNVIPQEIQIEQSSDFLFDSYREQELIDRELDLEDQYEHQLEEIADRGGDIL